MILCEVRILSCYMKLPDLDPTGGAIELSEVLIEYDGPQLFVAQNAGGAFFLALHGPSDQEGDTWLFCRVTARRISRLKRFEITLREALVERSKGQAAIVTYKNEKILHTEYVETQNIQDAFLPEHDSYLGSPENDNRSIYIDPVPSDNFLNFESFEENLPFSTSLSLWEMDNKAIEYFRSKMTPLNIVANRRGRLVADIIFAHTDDHTYFPIPELGKILINMQKTVDTLASAEGLRTSTGRPTAALKKMTRLDAVAIFPSSFGLRVEANQGSLISGSESETAFRRFLGLLGSIIDTQLMREEFAHHTLETKLFFGEVIKEVAKAGSSIRVALGSAYEDRIDYVSVPAGVVARLATEISEINSSYKIETEFEGRLTAVSLKSKFFLIEDDNDSRSGRISDELMPQMSGAEINAFYRVTISERTVVHEITGEIDLKRILIGFKKISPAKQ